MSSEEDIPVPDNSGSFGNQKNTDLGPELVKAEPLADLPIAQTIAGLAATKSRALGGEVVSALIAGSTAQIAHELGRTKDELSEMRRRHELSQKELSESNLKNAVLEERIRGDGKNRHLRNFSIFVGTTLLGSAIHLSNTEQPDSALAAGALGVLLLLLGWFSGSRRPKS